MWWLVSSLFLVCRSCMLMWQESREGSHASSLLYERINPITRALPLYLLLFSHPVKSNSLQPHTLQQARPPGTSPSPEICPSSFPLDQWLHPAISSSDDPYSFCPQFFPAPGTSPMSWLFPWDDQDTGASASASVLSMNIQGWFPLRLTGLISLLFKGFSGVFSSTTVWRHQFFSLLPSLLPSSHSCRWPLGRP